jgi:hypothetical protein
MVIVECTSVTSGYVTVSFVRYCMPFFCGKLPLINMNSEII